MMAILKINIHTHDFGEIKLVTRCWSKWEHEEQHEDVLVNLVPYEWT